MERKKLRIIAIGTILIIIAITTYILTRKTEIEQALYGRWYAAKLTECEKEILISTSGINLEFKSNGTYLFNSTLNVHEEGVFKVKGKLLTLQDKIKPKSPVRNLLISRVQPDTLLIEMNNKGLDQTLLLLKDFRKLNNNSDTSKLSGIVK